MLEMNAEEIDAVSGGVSGEAGWSASLGVSGGLLALGLTVTAPVWGTAFLLGGSIAASCLAIKYVISV